MPLLDSFTVDHTRMEAPAVRVAKKMNTELGMARDAVCRSHPAGGVAVVEMAAQAGQNAASGRCSAQPTRAATGGPPPDAGCPAGKRPWPCTRGRQLLAGDCR